MRRVAIAILAMASFPMLAQVPPRERGPRPQFRADAAEAAVKQSSEALVLFKKTSDRDLEVLRHLRAADAALTDPMQPNTAVQKAYEEIDAAARLQPEFLVMQGVNRAQREVEAARRSPMSADFGRLRAVVHEAVVPASRVVVRNAMRLEEEALAWLKVQQLIGDHLRSLSEIASQSLRASDQP